MWINGYLNTSNVKVQLDGKKVHITGQTDLNTSNVKVQRC